MRNTFHAFRRWAGALTLASALAMPLSAARADELASAFDREFGTQQRAPSLQNALVQPWQPASQPQRHGSAFEASLAAVANAEQGRIGVAALDLSSGRMVGVLGDQPFPMASTSKIAIVATFLEGVDRGRWRLDQQFPLMVPLPSPKFDGPVAPVRPGASLSAQGLIELAITRSDNQATDALLAVVGGPGAVNDWIRRAGISGMRIDRDIATLVRDDGAIDPATQVDVRDSATPKAMLHLLAGLHRGEWLSPQSRAVLLGAMARCETGKRRIPALMPEGARVAHKTGTLSNTASDVGLIQTPDGRTMAVAIYVTGQGGKPYRDARIANIARTIYDGYLTESASQRRTASR